MKKLLYLAGLVLALGFFSSCEKDGNGDIVGSWQSYKLVFKYYENGTLVEEGEDLATEADQKMVWTFKKDGTIEANLDGKTESAQYTVKGSTLTIDDEGELTEYVISSLTSDELVLKVEEDFGDDGYAEEFMHFRKL